MIMEKLQKKHLPNVPFENLDIHYRTPIKPGIDRIYEKIVQNNRGGFCYELNGLFYELLLSPDFDAKQVSARVYTKDNEYSPEFDHLTIVVKIGNAEYLTDVGFGEFVFGPLRLQSGKIQNDRSGSYLFDRYKDGNLGVNKSENGRATPEFIFKNVARELEEFTEMCEYHRSDPNSHFIKKKID